MRARTTLTPVFFGFLLLLPGIVTGQTYAERERHEYGIYESSVALKQKATPEFLSNLGDDDPWFKDAVRGLLFSGYSLDNPGRMPPGYRAILDEMEWRGDRLLPLYMRLLGDPRDMDLHQVILGHFWDIPTLDAEPFIDHIRNLVDSGMVEHAELGLMSVCQGILLGLGGEQDVPRLRKLDMDETTWGFNRMLKRLEAERQGAETPMAARKRKKEERIAELQRQRETRNRPAPQLKSTTPPPTPSDSEAGMSATIFLYAGFGLLVLAILVPVIKVFRSH